ncbi:hypothetical protein MNV84_06387 [Leishmania braziliensis]|nr:hypothetical protein MNV84_06387 [Leishmania braziliensis]
MASMASLGISTGFTRASMPLIRCVSFATVLLLLLLCSRAQQACSLAVALTPTVEQSTAALSDQLWLLSEYAISKTAALVPPVEQMGVTREEPEAARSFAHPESKMSNTTLEEPTTTTTTEEPTTTTTTEEPTTTTTTEEPTTTTTTEEPTTTTTTEEPTTTTTTEEPTTTTTTEEPTTTTTTAEPTTTTTTAEPTTTTTTAEPTTTTALPTRSPITFSVGALAGVVAGGIAVGIFFGVGVTLLVMCCPCFLPCCKRGSQSEQEVDDNFAEAHEMAETGCSGSSEWSSKHENGVKGIQNSVKLFNENVAFVAHDDNNVNPLAPPFVPSPKSAPPLVAGDPAHVNTFNNRPYIQNGIVPWTGRPPVLRGPQPACMVPTITKEGEVIPRERRVLPGLGLFETPIIPIALPVPSLPPPKTGAAAAVARAKALFQSKVLRQFCGSASAEEEQAVAEAAKRDQPVIQWFHRLVYFTALANSPEISGLDESDTDKSETQYADEDTAAVVVAVPTCTADSGASDGAHAKPPLPATAGTPQLAPYAALATPGMPLTAMHYANSQYQVPPGLYGAQYYPLTHPQMPGNTSEMMLRGSLYDADHLVVPAYGMGGGAVGHCPAPGGHGGTHAAAASGSGYSFLPSSQRLLSPQAQPNQQGLPLVLQQTTLSKASRSSVPSTVPH